MKCKNCGGELLFQNGNHICESCGATIALANVFENIDVCICYIECDSAGRRTRDSIVAQEVYRKLEAARINAFYERISAGGAADEELEKLRYGALQQAKSVLVLGASAESFRTLSEKYCTYLEGKTVIPFCVDVEPSAIPASMRKIQAVNYNTIGWDVDLINSLYTLLGREKAVDTGSLYAKAKKKKLILIGVGVLVILLGVLAFLLVALFGKNAASSRPGTQATTPSETQATTQPTERPLTQQEIYDQAVALMESGSYCEALETFAQIPEHANSANMIKQIYSKYEGYYQSANTIVHLEIVDNTRAEIDVRIEGQNKVIRTVANGEISVTKVVCDYLDNHKNTGKLELTLENTGLHLKLKEDGTTVATEAVFSFENMTDQPALSFDAQKLLGWLKKPATYKDIVAEGYILEEIEIWDRAGDNRLYKIQYSDIYVSLFGDAAFAESITHDTTKNPVLLGVTAPAETIAPFLIGSQCVPDYDEDTIYWPNASLSGEGANWMDFNGYVFREHTDTIYTGQTLVGIAVKDSLHDFRWGALTFDVAVRKKYNIQNDSFINQKIVAENDTDRLVVVNPERTNSSNLYAWYRINKKNHKFTFLREGPYQEDFNRISEDLWFSEYLPFALEFPDASQIKPGTYSWLWRVMKSFRATASELACERYNLTEPASELVAENSTHMLVAVQTGTMQCAWYRCSLEDGSVSFVREGGYDQPFVFTISDKVWFTEYPDFAAEFPDAFPDSPLRDAQTPEESTPQ